MSGIRAFPPLAIIPELILYSHSRDILYTFFGSLLATNNFKFAFAVTLLFIFWYIAGMICYNKNKGILRRGIFGFNKLWDSEDNFYRRLVFVSSPLAASVASMASWIVAKDVFTSFDLLSNGLFAFILISSSISSFLVLLYFLCSRLFFYFRYIPVNISGLIASIILCTLFLFDLVFMSIIEGFIFYKRGKTPTKGMATFTQVWLLNQAASMNDKFWNYSYNISIFLSEFFSFNLSIFFAWIISVTFYYVLTYSLFNYQGIQF
ncbi:MAG: hypothetical protein WCP16_01465 [Pseudanabaena sp. ELA645]